MGDEDKQISDWGIAPLFQLLSLDVIVKLFHCLLIEKPVVFICSNLGLLSAVVYVSFMPFFLLPFFFDGFLTWFRLSFLPILRPYVFQGPFIPILPLEMLEFLEAPVPYVIGVPQLPADFEKKLREEGKVIVRVDTNTLHLLPNTLTQLPEEKNLYPTSFLSKFFS